MRKTISPEQKFLRYIDKRGEDECWGWKGRFTKYGAGIFTIEHTIDGERTVENYFANRFSYEYFTGEKINTRYLDNVCDRRDCCNPKHMRQRDFDARFWENVDKTGDCWLWKGKVDRRTGYGYITVDHESVSTHRLSYEVYYNAKVPEGLMVIHSCNTRRCINPLHLRVGTHLDNMKDMVECGHSCKGEKNGNAVLTESDVQEIKVHFLKRDLSQRKIANKFGVSISTVKDIASGRCWNWVNVQELL
jgi:predicted XRE-type DNA-binding protein